MVGVRLRRVGVAERATLRGVAPLTGPWSVELGAVVGVEIVAGLQTQVNVLMIR